MDNGLASIVDKLRDGATWRWDIQNSTLCVSPRIAHLLGVSPEELLTPADFVANASKEGVTDQDLSNKHQIEAFIDDFAGVISSQESYELVFLTGGRKRFLWLRAEVRVDLQSNSRYISGELDDITTLLRRARRATEQARIDEMSGLLRREHFIRTMKSWLAPNIKMPVCFFVLIAIDLDGLSIINNHYGGHAAGDDVIQSFGKRLQRLQSDDTVIGRVGGDEFSVFARCETSEDFESLLNSVHVQTRYAHTLADHVECDTRQIQVSASIGVTSRPPSLNPDEDTIEMMRQADDACYISKQHKNQQYIVFTPQIKEDIERERDNRLVLSETLRENTLPLAWMPIINLATGRIVGAEVLLDDTTKDLMGAKSNEEVIKSLSDLALLEDHDLGNLFHAMQEIRAINAEHPDHPLFLSVNLSPKNLVPKNNGQNVNESIWPSEIVQTIEELMKWTPFPPHLLHIEISEDAPLEQTVEVQATLGELKRLGVRLVCDDFGKNYSNLDRLFLFPDFDIYKLDMVLTRQLLGQNERARKAVLLHIQALAVMGKEICAEGVEHVEQYLRLKKAGCQMAQGYLFTNEKGQPGGKLSTEHFKQMIRNNGVLNWVNELSDFHVLDDTRSDHSAS